nr:ABC-2 transporter permease [Clostridium aminobutyricum]
MIIKDFLNLKKQAVPIGAFLILYFVISALSGDSTFFAGVLMMSFAILPITALAYDDRANWNKYALTMPISRQMLVVSKYLMALILLGIGGLTILLFNTFFGNYNLHEGLLATCTMMFIGVLIFSISLPLNYKFGTEKSRYILIGVCVLPAVFVSMLGIGVTTEPSDEMVGILDLLEILLESNWFIAAELLLSAIVFFVSMMASVRIIQKKEF